MAGAVFAFRFLPEEMKNALGGFLFGEGGETTAGSDETTTAPDTTDGTTEAPSETKDIYEWNYELPHGATAILPCDRSANTLCLFAENPTDVILEAVAPSFPKKSGGEITVLIVNTHSFETYAEENAAYYTDASFASNGEETQRVGAVAKALCDALGKNGINALFIDCMAESSFGSYQNAWKLLDITRKGYPSATLVIDIHRAILIDDTGALLRPITAVDGEIAAQARILLGDGGEYELHTAAALAFYECVNSEYDRLMMPISVSKGVFLQESTVPVLTLEIGSAGNSVSEACRTAELLADVIAQSMLS